MLSRKNWEEIGGLKELATFSKKRQIYKYKDIIQRKGDYTKGILPTSLVLTTTVRDPPSKRVKLGKSLYQGEKISVFSVSGTIFVIFRSTMTFGELFGVDFTMFRKESNLELGSRFKIWREKVYKTNKKTSTLLHSGFLKEYRAQKYHDIILDSIEKSKIKNPKITFLGRSMGGAIACIAALNLSIYRPNLKFSIISISAPAISNTFISLYFSYLAEKGNLMNFIRLYNKKDIVTSIKTGTLGSILKSKLRHPFQYAKKGQVVRIKSDNTSVKKGVATIDINKQTSKVMKKLKMASNILNNHSAYTFSFSKKGEILFSYRNN